MNAHSIVTASLLMLAAAGCATSSQLDRHFAAGQLLEVARMFEADSSLQVHAGALYRAGLAYALPDSPARDPERALAVFDRLQSSHPGHPHREHVAHLQQLLRYTQAHREREARHDGRVVELTAQLEEQQARITELEEDVTRERTRADAVRVIADRLDREVRERDRRIRMLEEELTALKEIDLGRPPSRGAPGDPPRPPRR